MIPSLQTLSETAGRAAFRTYLKPYLAKLLTAIGLDVLRLLGAGQQ